MTDTFEKIVLDDRYILWDRKSVESVIGLGTTGLYRAIREDGFPKPIRVGGRVSKWRKSEVLEWIDSRPQRLEYEC